MSSLNDHTSWSLGVRYSPPTSRTYLSRSGSEFTSPATIKSPCRAQAAYAAGSRVSGTSTLVSHAPGTPLPTLVLTIATFGSHFINTFFLLLVSPQRVGASRTRARAHERPDVESRSTGTRERTFEVSGCSARLRRERCDQPTC